MLPGTDIKPQIVDSAKTLKPKKCHAHLRICTINHGLCDSNKLLYKRCAKSTERPKFQPPTAPTFFNRS